MKNSKRFLRTFLAEWKLAEGRVLRTKADNAKASNPDPNPEAGELRVLVGLASPLVVALLRREGDAFVVVPVSDFTVPAIDSDILIGGDVFQLWNAVKMPVAFVRESYVVRTLSVEDLEDLGEALRCTVARRKLPKDLADCVGAPYTNGEVFAYLSLYGGMTRTFERVAPEVRRHRALASRIGIGFGAIGIGFGAAALLMVSLAMLFPTLCRPRVMKGVACVDGGRAYQITIVRPERPLELVDLEAEEDVNSPNGQLCEMKMAAPAVEEVVAVDGAAQPAAAEKRSHTSAFGGMMMRGPSAKMKVARCEVAESAVMAEPLPVPKPAPDSMEDYAAMKENEFLDPAKSPLSTFGLDVDTASYATMRRYLVDNKRLPPRKSVRIEEFVNYFQYAMPAHRAKAIANAKYGADVNRTAVDPINVGAEIAPCPWNSKHQLLRVALKAREVADEALPAANLVFLIDVSGSMGWNGGLDMVKNAMHLLTRKLRPQDTVSIVTYASGTRVVLEATSGKDRARIDAAIDALNAGGSTAGGAGIKLAYEQAKKHFDARGNNRVIIATDGDFNVGINNPDDLEEFIADKRKSGIFLTVLGVGRGNYRDAMMKRLAKSGNGNYAFIDSVLEAKKVMMTEFGGTLLTVAKDVKLQLEFNPALVCGYRLLGYENRLLAAKDFNDDKKDAGEMGAGHNMTAFYEIIPSGLSGDPVEDVDALRYQTTKNVKSDELLTVKIRWKEPDAEKSLLNVYPIREKDIKDVKPSDDFEFASAVAEFALLLENSEFKGNASFADVVKRAKASKGKDENGYRAEFIRLAETAELMSTSSATESATDDDDVRVNF